MNRTLNFYIASGSSQTLTEFPGVRELIKSLQAGEEPRNTARRRDPWLLGKLPRARCLLLEIRKLARMFRGVSALEGSGDKGKTVT